MLKRKLELVAQAEGLSLLEVPTATGSCDQPLDLTLTLNALASGLSRCVTLSDLVFWSDGMGQPWFPVLEQSWHFQLLFRSLNNLMIGLANYVDPSGLPLIETTTVVVCSDFGRHPQRNSLGGKHHWPVGSALIIGGVTGGRTLGGFSERVLSQRVDPLSGDLTSLGIKLRPANIGATLLALADVDPAAWVDAEPILGAI